jgi:hypothetical protein
VVTPVTRQTPLFQKNQQPQMNQTLQQNPIIKQQNPIIKQQNPLIKQQNPIIPNQQKPLNQQQNQSMQIVQKNWKFTKLKNLWI